MDCTIKRLGYFPLLGFLFVAAFVLPSCGLIPKTTKAPETITWLDGTVSEKGSEMYRYADGDRKGQGTALEVNPETGTPNEPLPVDDVEKGQHYADQGEKFAGALPPPFGGLVALGIAGLGAGGLAIMRRRREKQIADAGGKKKS